MELKRIAILTAMVSSITLGSASGVLAASGTPVPIPTRVTVRETAVAARTDADLDARRKHEVARIDGRIDELNKLISRLQSDSHLNANDKAALLAEDQNAISVLNTLKAKIQADTTLADVVADGKQIVTYHIRDVLLPQNREVIMVDEGMALSTKLGTSISDVQSKVNALQGQGVNVSALQSLLSDMTAKQTAANNLLAADDRTLLAITATTANAQSTFTQVRNDLKTVRSDFSGIRDDAKQIKQQVPRSSGATPTPTP
jgi:hypothetical protein